MAKILMLAAAFHGTHAADQCVTGTHGPACSEDSDCSAIKDCVRCASSGFCTDVALPGPSPGPRPSPSPGPSPPPGPSPAEGCTTSNTTFDYLALVQGWPNSWCLTHTCEAAYSQSAVWTIHGLWPSRVGAMAASYPCECDTRAFDESAVSSIEGDLNKYWTSFSDNKKFWDHEWTKHGTCTSEIFSTELDFFSSTLKLRQEHDIASALTKAGITAGNDKKYTSTQVLTALTSIGGGFQPLLGCIKVGSIQYLHEITFCLDKKSQANIHCDDAVKASGGEVSNCDYSQTMVLIEPGTKPSASILV